MTRLAWRGALLVSVLVLLGPGVTGAGSTARAQDITVTPTALSIDEGAADSFDVVLTVQPTSDVVVTLATDAARATLSDASLTFTDANWDQPQTVTVTALENDVADGAHGVAVATDTDDAASADEYDAVDPADVGVTINDNDVADVTISETGGTTAVTEGGVADSYTVVLTSEPTADVLVTLTADAADVTLSDATLTFTAANWDQPQAVLVTAVDDDFDEGPQNTTITHGIDGASAAEYLAVTPDDVDVAITDDDTAGVVITPLTLAVAEAGETSASYSVVLSSEPVTAAVTVLLDFDDTQVSTNIAPPYELTFLPSEWNIPQTVTVTAIDDGVAEADPHVITITHDISGGNEYKSILPIDVTVDIADDDEVGIAVTPVALSLSETGPTSDSYTVVLTSEPTADVTVEIAPSEAGQVSVNHSQLVFTPGNWFMPRTVIVTAIDDGFAEAPHPDIMIEQTVAGGSAAEYVPVDPADVTVSITDNDVAGVSITETGADTTVTEGGAGDSYRVVLTSRPRDPVTIDMVVSPDAPAEITIAPTQLVFDPSEWNLPQTVVVAAVDDAIDDDDDDHSTIAHTASSADGDYNLALDTIDVTVNDNDTAGVVITPTALSVSEEGETSASYSVVLSSRPRTAAVTVLLDFDDAQVSTNIAPPYELNFLPDEWNIPQTITVTAIDDGLDETDPHFITITHDVSGGSDYKSIPPIDVDVTIADNDTAGVTITPLTLTLDEEGTPVQMYGVNLDSQPFGDVVVDIAADLIGQVDINPIQLTFTNGGWDAATPQMVSVSAVDDDVVENPHPQVTISHAVSTAADPAYAGIPADDVTTTINDNDVAGVTITPTAINVDEAGPTSATYDVNLDTRPIDDVTVTLTFDPNQVDVTPTVLTFTPGGWSDAAPQQVQVTAKVDNFDEAPQHQTTIMHTVASPDVEYDELAAADVTVTITDNDTATVEVVLPEEDAEVTEGDPASSFDYLVRLDIERTTDVTVQLTPSVPNQIVWTPATVVIPAGSTEAPIRLTAVDDDAVEPTPMPVDIVHTAGDPNETLAVIGGPLTCNVLDNETVGLVILTTDPEDPDDTFTVFEGGVQDTYTIALRSQPSDTVVVTLDPDDQLNLGAGAGVPISVMFTPADWDVPHTIPVAAVDDEATEGPHTGTITHTIDAATADPFYGDPALNLVVDIIAEVVDDDAGGITLRESGDGTSVEEGGFTDVYSIVLETVPLADVTIVATPDNEEVVLGGAPAGESISHVFNAANFSEPWVIDVQAFNDDIVEGPQSTVITHTVVSANAAYGALGVPNVTVMISDDDMAGVIIAPTGGSTFAEEGGAGDAYTVVLTSAPTANVTVTAMGDPTQVALGATETTTGPSFNVVFTPANWDTPQTVAVVAFDDGLSEGGHTTQVSHTVSSADDNYDGIAVADATVNIFERTNDDRDGDGLLDTEELRGFTATHWVADGTTITQVTVRFRTDPARVDTDGDGVWDLDEVVTYARQANPDGTVPGVPELGAAPGRANLTIFGPSGPAPTTPGRRAKSAWGVRTIASSDVEVVAGDFAGVLVGFNPQDTDGDAISDPNDPAPQLNPVVAVANAEEDLIDAFLGNQTLLINFDPDEDGYADLDVIDYNEANIEALRNFDYSNDGTLDDGFDLGGYIDGVYEPFVWGDGVLNDDAMFPTDNCPGQFNPAQIDEDGDGVGDDCLFDPNQAGQVTPFTCCGSGAACGGGTLAVMPLIMLSLAGMKQRYGRRRL